MRIGIVAQSFPPARGGVAEHAVHTAKELQGRGHEVTIITSRFTPFDDDLGLDVRRIGRDVTIPANGAFINISVGWGLKRKMRAIEQERKFDVVHIHSPLEPILPFLAVDAFQAPKVGTFHSFVKNGVPIYRLLNGWVRGRFDRLAGRIAVSEAAKGFISQYFPGDIQVIPNGVDCERFRPDREPLAGVKKPGEFVVLFVGRLDVRKGLRHLLLAMPYLRERLPNVRLVVVGSGILEAHYKGILPPEYRDRVKFEGFVSADELPKYYAAADVFCAPAVSGESFGIVLIEGMAAGKPIVASDITGYNSIVKNDVDGLLVPARNSEAIAQAIIRLHDDPALRQRLSDAGRAKALTFDWKSVTDQLEAVYRRAIART